MNRSKLLLTLFVSVCLIALCPLKTFAEKGAESDSENRIRVLLAPEVDTVLSSQLTGKIIEINVSMGRIFEKDEILVKFDCEEHNARLKIYEAEQKAAEITYNSKIELKELSSSSTTEVQLAEASLEKAKAQILLQKTIIDNCVIRAPFKGGNVRTMAKVFQIVPQGQPIMEIISAVDLKVKMNMPSRLLKNFGPGSVFYVIIDENGQRYDGKITAINKKIDAVSQTVEVEGAILNATKDLIAGMSGYAYFEKGAKKRKTIK